jgi:Fe-S-cluster containining protein
MADERTEFGFKRIECACSECLRNCYALPGYLIPADLRRIADYLGEEDIVRFALENLLASPGALVVANGEIFAIPTIVPARRPDGACRFLKNDLCSIHAVNPFGCAFFSSEQTKEQSDAISARGLMEIMKSWRQGDLYARLWARLYEAGCIAPSPLEARARMKDSIDSEEPSRDDPPTK